MSGAEFARFGGNTTCFEIELPGGHRVLIDAGSGLRGLEPGPIQAEEPPPLEATLLLTHFHWDHIQGLPFLPALYRPSTRIEVVASPPDGFTVAEALGGVIRPPWFPIRLEDVAAQLSFRVPGETPFGVGPLEITAAPLAHPGGVSGYRIAHAGGVLAIATDVEAADASAVEDLRRFAEGASVLIHDAQYTPEEYEVARRGWGHSTWQQATLVAKTAGVRRLVLTSHDPTRTDGGIEALVAAARARFPSTEAAFPGQLIEF